VLILRGFLQGQTTQHIAEELGLDYGTLLSWRHRIQRRGFAHLINSSLPDTEAEMDEMFQNAGEIAILWRVFGLVYAISCVPFAVFTKNICIFM